MGRKSRAKAELRNGLRIPTAKEARRAAAKANHRGSVVQPTVEGYEGVSRRGEDKLIEALIARHTSRMLNIATTPDRYVFEVLRPLLSIGVLDRAHVALGVPLERFPADFHGDAADHLAWGLDSTVAACRLLLAGQVVGAAVVARQQLERWTLLLANVRGVEREHRESVQDFIARCWTSASMQSVTEEAIDTSESVNADRFDDTPTTTGEPAVEHEHVELSDGTEICPTVVYGSLSEIIHGDNGRDTTTWESAQLLSHKEMPADVWSAIGSVCDALSLSIIQLKIATAVVCENRGHRELAERLLMAGDRVEGSIPWPEYSETADGQPRSITRPMIPAVMPLTVNEGLEAEPTDYLASRSALYASVLNGQLPAGRLYQDDELLMLAFTTHRHSSAVAARAALDREMTFYGDDFKPQNLVGRGITFVLIAEIAALCSRWSTDNPELAAAAAVVSSSLRSAYWLWLEDDDRAMAALRCTLEQSARIRAWRAKPAKATLLEANSATTPRDWLEAASWRRLGALNRALSEFAHAHPGSRWDGARDLLTALQVAPDERIAPFTARGSALDFVATLAARETINVIADAHSPLIAATMRAALAPSHLELSPDDHALDAIFDHVWTERSRPLGPPQFAQAKKVPESGGESGG
ncbi:hypothetical protein FHT44_002838 [Mycolicibacterium sp. BK634]|uniref:hypothetical protein n=1 Tax=Mycolicibacterium sp. BK634 TaxID=2587099 RepID=UPI0016096F0A|nr:hypothetical protein [Mycolicibacterium sp. BK634]MBB3750377.1 hypothetical protein [Mycolicibacterium sp. BK634]